jgi:hypothetical protein
VVPGSPVAQGTLAEEQQ